MKRSSSLVVAFAVTAMAITAIGAPVAAAGPKTKLAIVNGFAGKKVDVCVNGKEIRSGLPYGKAVFKTTKTNKARVRFFARDRRSCKGTTLGTRTVYANDATVVLTRKKPRKVITFDNAGLDWIYDIDIGSTYTMRHAADLGALTFKSESDGLNLDPVVPAFDPTWQKGDSSGRELVGVYGHSYMVVAVTRPAAYEPFVDPDLVWLETRRRYEWIAVGSTQKNARLVRLDRRARVVPFP